MFKAFIQFDNIDDLKIVRSSLSQLGDSIITSDFTTGIITITTDSKHLTVKQVKALINSLNIPYKRLFTIVPRIFF